VAFAQPAGAGATARAARAASSALSSQEWLQLIARLGEIPDPTVQRGPSSAAIPDTGQSAKEAGGNH
jgi:hypothetical protein